MKTFDSVTFTTADIKDFDVESRFADIKVFLSATFNNDYQAMENCMNDYHEKLDSGDSETENGNHKWSEVESGVNKIAFDGAEWLYFQNSPSIEIKL